MKLAGIHHVALCVRDIDEALAFYVGALGMEKLERPDFGFPGAWLQVGGQQVHLMATGDQVPQTLQHFALAVDDLDAVVTELEGAGVAVRRSDRLPGAGRQAFLNDPSGNGIELNQPD
jgi:catechol 2,3-dioxygenase-like lactoylglutathione lyase family enzyme